MITTGDPTRTQARSQASSQQVEQVEDLSTELVALTEAQVEVPQEATALPVQPRSSLEAPQGASKACIHCSVHTNRDILALPLVDIACLLYILVLEQDLQEVTHQGPVLIEFQVERLTDSECFSYWI